MEPTAAFFAGIAPSEIDAALGGLERRRLPEGATIVAEGDYLAEMYVLATGSGQVFVADRNGRAQLIGSVRTGETIGEMSLLTGETASATVRAGAEIELLVLSEPDLEALIERLPRIQRNIIAILSARLARMTRLAVRPEPGRIVVVEHREGPQVLDYALAASIAWHTRTRTLHLVVAERPPDELFARATLTATPPWRPRRQIGADLLVTRPEGSFEQKQLPTTLEQLAQIFDVVVARLSPGESRQSLAGAAVVVGSPVAPEGGFALISSAETGLPAHRDRVVRVPELTRSAEDELAQGQLSPATASGRALGWLARDLTELKVGVALGSGSVRGYAHVGALRALERLGVPIDCLAGTSIGAIVAGLYAYLQDTDQVIAFLDELGKRMFRPTLSRKSLLSTRAMRRYIRTVVGDLLLEEFPIPLAVVATDVDTQEEVVLRRGSSVTALFASAAIPGVFPAIRIGNRTLVDGGVVNPVPTNVAAQLGAGVMIGIRLVSGGGTEFDELSQESEGPIPSAVAAIIRSIELVQTRITSGPPTGPTIIVTPEFEQLPSAKLRNFREGRQYVPAGEHAVEAALPRLQTALPWLR